MRPNDPEGLRQVKRAGQAALTWRSGLEEEWAIFLTTLDLPFAYYPGEINFSAKKFALSALWLPRQEIWVQTVQRAPAPGVAQQAMRLADETGYDVALFFGAVALTDGESAYLYSPLSLHTGLFSSRMKWAECLGCGAICLSTPGSTDRFSCRCLPPPGEASPVAYDSPRLLHAYAQAQLPRALPLPVPPQEGVDAADPSSVIALSRRDH